MQADDKLMLEKMYEPVTKPLNSMSQSLEKQKLQNVLQSDRPTSKKKTELDISSNFFTPIHRKWKGILDGSDSDEENSVASYEENSPEIYIEGLYNKPSEYDTVYGVRTEKKHKNKYFIGDAEAKFNSGNIDLWRNNEKIGSFKGSNELYDLLFLKKPKVLDNLTKLSDNTLETYREILKRTHAMNHNYNKDKKIRTSRWPKFSELLDPLFKPTQETAEIGKSEVPTTEDHVFEVESVDNSEFAICEYGATKDLIIDQPFIRNSTIEELKLKLEQKELLEYMHSQYYGVLVMITAADLMLNCPYYIPTIYKRI
ncbi:unnamed protein product [Ceutorhynchus assimilis]|uniref:DUF8207 domain-containing protein n=1 Tax=Ceutorhynchus assimilis TaxID=467358 RepID=A0A9N9MUB4_9CUCU|nr:unnamed protein product [Ceutorhynchus assimilis]